MRVVIVDYGSGNLRSAAKAFERVVTENAIKATITVSANAADVAQADRVVLPGVGAFADCRAGLLALPGMADALQDHVFTHARPFLGICVGMQLLATSGTEHGDHVGLGWIPGQVVPITPHESRCKVPHMGWNELQFDAERHPVLRGLPPAAHAYFVHSYHFDCQSPDHRLACVEYSGSITAMVGRDNVVGTQFHPEKSQATGLTVIKNFLQWMP
jgi:imidazole glycerol-phosphate synthase subunit HisH